MQRHIADRPTTYDSAIKLREYVRIAREHLPNRASKTLQRRAAETVSLAQFIRIARGQRA